MSGRGFRARERERRGKGEGEVRAELGGEGRKQRGWERGKGRKVTGTANLV